MLVKDSIEYLKANGLYRKRLSIQARENVYLTIEDQKLVNFISNDYLQLSQHPDVIESVVEAVKYYGFGASASAMVSGFQSPHEAFENAFSAHVEQEASLLFNSGYHANLAVMQCFSDRHTTVIADKLVHASLLDGVQISRATLKRYRHVDYNHAREILANLSGEKLLVTESVFSMEGDIADIEKLAELSKQHNASFIVDDAHGFGTLGNDPSRTALARLTITPLGKAMGGVGAVVSGCKADIEYLVQHARSYRYSTAMPASSAVGLLAALRVIQQEPERREQLIENIRHFNYLCGAYGIVLVSNQLTPIRSILIGDNQKTEFVQAALRKKGIIVSCIRPATVPKGTARLRITLTCGHTRTQIAALVRMLVELL